MLYSKFALNVSNGHKFQGVELSNTKQFLGMLGFVTAWAANNPWQMTGIMALS